MHLVMLKGQRFKYEGYPEWYEQELLKNEPINIDKFEGNIETAAKFYFKEVNKLYFANTVLTTQLNAATEEKLQLAEWIEKLEETEKESYEEKKKRVRRCASQIERKFICQVPNCDKSYGTEGSMAQHMRLKHPEIDYNGICYEVKQIKEDSLPKIKEK